MNKIARFFEEHVEKMVLAVVGLVCAWLLITRVIFSPNVVEIDGQKLSPTRVDEYIYGQALDLRREIGRPVNEVPAYKPRLPEFALLMDSALDDIRVEVAKVGVQQVEGPSFASGVYRIPDIGDVSDVAVNHIRAVAYVPLAEVTPENPYDKAGNEPNDLDLISVEAKFDVEKLYKKFRAFFFEDVEKIYADPCLAKPIFAKVQLQRQQLNDDGTWSQWQEVPRPMIDHNKHLFDIGEKVDDLPAGGLKVLKVQFGYKQTQIDLLQPMAYQFASAREEWFPPSLHGKYAEFQSKERAEEIRRQREEEKESRERAREERTGSRRSGTDAYGGLGVGGAGTSRRGGTGTDAYRGGGTIGGNTRSRNRSSTSGTGLPGETTRSSGRGRGSGRRSTTDPLDNVYGPGGMEGVYGVPGTAVRGPRRETINDVYLKYDEIALSRLTDFSKIDEPLMFWAHDDTVEPGNTYRYRIRLGVFNPVAGTNKLDERYKQFEDQAILWSGFSDVTGPVEIMKRIYFFANDVREADKTVTVQVSRLTLGQWYTHDFPVRQGELMGESLEYEPEEPDRRGLGAGSFGAPVASTIAGTFAPGVTRPTGPGVSARTTAFGGSQETSNIPEYIDYSTGAVMVDAVPVSDWSSGRVMRSRRYYDMLYSYDGINILHMPVGRTNWPQELIDTFGTINRLARVPQEPFKSFGQGASRRGTMYDMGGYEDMMYEDMGGYENMGLY